MGFWDTLAEKTAKAIADKIGDVNITVQQTVRVNPELCPVCKGMGHVPHGFYAEVQMASSNAIFTLPVCRACGGRGVVQPDQVTNE
jgi:hypothetical protein